MKGNMQLLVAVALLWGVLAENTPMSEEEYMATRKKASFRSTLVNKIGVPDHLETMFDDLSKDITPVTHGVDRVTAAHPDVKGHIPAWADEADALPEPLDLEIAPVKLNAHGIDVTPDYVLGPDNRKFYSSKAYPYSTVVRVIMSSGGLCSGVLIGPRHVLTASHCVNWPTAYPTSVEVNRQGSYVAATSRVTDIYFNRKVDTPSSPYTLYDVDDDYVVMILSLRLGDRFGWLGATAYKTVWDDKNMFTNIGYAGDKRSMLFPIRQSGFSLKEDDFQGSRSGLAIKTRMDLISGQSGSPVYTVINGERYVVAVASGHSGSSRTNWVGGGQDLVDLVSKARKEKP